MKDEAARIEAEVQKRVSAIVEEQQKQFAATMEMMMKNSLGGVDQVNTDLEKERKRLETELDKAYELIRKAEREGEQMAYDSFQKHRLQYIEEAQLTLLRDLTRRHVEVGKTNRDIAVWLDVPQEFVENIRRIVNSVEQYRSEKPRKPLEGNPKISISTEGRGGTVYFESRETKFDLWWEYGMSASIIVEVPTREDWAVRTELPVSRRDETLNFIGEELVLKVAAYTGYFIVGENVLTVYFKEPK